MNQHAKHMNIRIWFIFRHEKEIFQGAIITLNDFTFLNSLHFFHVAILTEALFPGRETKTMESCTAFKAK